MSIENSKKYEDLFIEKTTEINNKFHANSEAIKNDYTIKGKEIDEKNKAYYASIDESKAISDEELEKKLQKLNQKIDDSNEKYERFLDDLVQTTKEKNSKLYDEINSINQEYDDYVNKMLRIYDENNNYLLKKKDLIKSDEKLSVTNTIHHNEADIANKIELIERSAKHYDYELKSNKNTLLDEATITNDIVKQIKKNYIVKEDALKREFEYNIYKLNDQIKEIQAKAIEEQKPFLNQFKDEFEKCDQDMLEIRKKYNMDIKAIDNEYFTKINLLKDKIQYLEKQTKENKKPDEIITLKNFKLQLKELKKEGYLKQMEIEKAYYKDINNLHLLQKKSETNKNININSIKADSDFEIMDIQENIKYQNQLNECNIRILKIQEKLEICEAEVNLNHSEILKAKNDSISTSNETAFHSDYEAKIEMLKLINENLAMREEKKRHIELFENEINCKRNETIMNMTIEHFRLEQEYHTNRIQNILSQNEIIFQKNKETLSIRSSIKRKNIELEKNSATEERNLVNNEYTHVRRLHEIEAFYQTSMNRIALASVQKNLNYESNRSIAKIENEIFCSSMNSLTNLLQLISNDLEETLLTNFQTFGISKIKRMMIKATKERSTLIKSYFKTIENIINKKIDDIASYKFKALLNDNEESRNEFITKANEQIESNNRQIGIIENEIRENESQIMYIEMDNNSLISRIKFLNNEIKVTKKDTEFNNERLINRYMTEIEDLKNNISSSKKEIKDFRHSNHLNELKLSQMKIDIINQKKAIVKKERSYERKLIKLNNAKIKEAKIYYDTISKINSLNRQFQYLYEETDNRIIHYFESNENPKKGNIKQIIDYEVNETKKHTKKMVDLLNLLYNNIVAEQNVLIKQNNNRLLQLKNRAEDIRKKRIIEENERYESQIKSSKINSAKALLEKNNFVKECVNKLKNNEEKSDKALKQTIKKNSEFDLIYKNKYHGLRANVIKIMEYLNNEVINNTKNDNKHIDEMNQLLEEKRNEINEKLKIYSLLNTKEIDLYNQKYQEDLAKSDEKTKQTMLLLNKEKKEVQDLINNLKKNYESAKDEINLEKIQFHDDLKNAKPISSIITKRNAFIDNITLIHNVKKKWR